MIEIVRYTQRNVKHWQDGDMRRLWTAARMLVAESSSGGLSATSTSPTRVIAILISLHGVFGNVLHSRRRVSPA